MRRWLKPSRLPLLIAWLVIGSVVWYVGSHPRLVAPYASGLVSRHLLRIENGGLRVRDFKVRAFEGMDLYGVSLTLPGNSGGMTLVSADTVAVDFGVAQILGAVPHLRRVTVRRPEVYSMAGNDTSKVKNPERIDLELPQLIIDHLVVSDAFLEFSDSGGRLSERISRLDWNGSLQTGEMVRAVMRGVSVDWETHASRLEGMRGEVIVDPLGISVKSVTGKFNDNFVRVGGYRNWDESLRLQVEAAGVSVDEVEDLIDMNIGFNARGDLVGSFEADNDTLWYEGVFTGDVEGYQAQELAGSAIVANEKVLLSDLAGNINGAEFTGRGHFDVTDTENVGFVLEGDVSQVDLAKGLILGDEDMPITDGTGRLRIEHWDSPLWTRVSGVLYDGLIEIIPFDTCYVDVEAYADTVVFNGIELFYQDLHVMLEGFSDSAEVFQGDVSVNSEDLATLPPDWQWPVLTGRANGQGQLYGPLDALDFDGNVNVYDLDFDPIAARDSDVALQVENVLGEPLITAVIEGRDFALGGVQLGDYTLRGSASATAARVDTFQAALGDTSVAVRFGAAFTDTIKSIVVEELDITLEGTHWSLANEVPISVGDGHFSIADLRLSSNQGAVSAAGVFDRGVQVAGGVQFEHFDLGLMNPFVESEEPLAGMLTADIVAGGDPFEPTVTINGNVVDAPFAMARVDSLEFEASYQAGTVDFQTLRLLSEFGRLRGSGSVSNPGAAVEQFWTGADLDMELRFVNADWAFLDQFAMPALERLSGRFDGQVRIAGSTDDPVLRGDVHSAPFHVHWLHLDELAANVWADSRGLVLGNLRGHKDDLQMSGRIEIPLELDFLSEPVAPLDGPFYMQLEVPPGSNMAALSRATNAFVTGTSSGTGEASVVIAGPLDHPFYQGHVNLENVGFVLRDLEEVYREASCNGRFSGDTLTLTNIKAREGLRGSLEGQGTLTFKGLMIETFDLRLNLDRFLLASIPDLRVIATSDNARMTGVIVGPDSVLVPKFHGDFEVIKARFKGDFKEKEGAVDPMAGTVAPDWLADLSLHAEPRVAHIINREMELALGGYLNLVRTEGGLNMRGSLDVNKGELIVFNNKFEVQRGRLDFSQEVGFDPRINLDAETEYRLRFAGSSNSVIEHIGVHVTGLMSTPEVQFSSERGYSTEAIQRMLLGLEPQATPEGDSRRLANSSISAGFNLLEREIAREVDIVDTIEIDQIQRQRATGDPGLDPLIGVGKYIGPDLYLKYAQGIRGMDDLDLIVEYQINRHLLLQSEIRRRLDENQGESTYNLDLKYRFEY
ncbi:MAG: translocation/assembly module TamB domain-containing protein [Candidatus Krumholzibacteria bacterium]|nr:translocation/assembly module TamB domain-containing protein [Candidatus Krumholzibacteria bacterium]